MLYQTWNRTSVYFKLALSASYRFWNLKLATAGRWWLKEMVRRGSCPPFLYLTIRPNAAKITNTFTYTLFSTQTQTQTKKLDPVQLTTKPFLPLAWYLLLEREICCRSVAIGKGNRKQQFEPQQPLLRPFAPHCSCHQLWTIGCRGRNMVFSICHFCNICKTY